MTESIEFAADGPNGTHAIRVSHPDKMYFPELGVSKVDMVRYFLSVGDGILRELRDRPTVFECFAARGDVHADLATRRFGLEALLEMAERTRPRVGAAEE